ncbi:MAG: proline--tRNA ligase [Candidatus Marinamargulisbacteria bacterium]
MHTYRNHFIHTSKECPNDADVVSHQLMVRSGMIKKLASGIYSILPLGHRVFSKIVDVVQDEMAAVGAMPCHLPCAIPAELWESSGRWANYGKELLRFNDRQGRSFCFGPTHEEVVTDLVSAYITSYKQLPVTLYQIQTKFRDEIRPRFGLMRGREFVMKDAYSFHDSMDSLDDMYQAMRRAYGFIFKRCGLKFIEAVADSGSIGGDVSMEFLVVAPSGEDEVLTNHEAGFAANTEACACGDSRTVHSGIVSPIETVDTPNKKTIQSVASFLKISADQCIKSLLIMVNDAPVLLCLPGDRDVNPAKVRGVLKGDYVLASDAEIIHHLGKDVAGYIGPIDTGDIPLILDYGLRQHPAYCCGANNEGQHLINVSPARDLAHGQWADIKQAIAGDPCPTDMSKLLTSTRGIEVGHIFKLGDTYSSAMGAVFNDNQGKRQPFNMGCYGIGIGRTIAAAIEQSHDDKGIIWPHALAPFHVVIIHLCPKDDAMTALVLELVQAIEATGNDVIVDDRNESPGVKFNDADLIGFPYQIVMGRKVVSSQKIEVKQRSTGTVALVPISDIGQIGQFI